jgi:hypothetical protein
MVAVPNQQAAVAFLQGERDAMRQIAREEIAAALANYTPGGLKPLEFECDSGDSTTALVVPVNAAGPIEIRLHCAAQTWWVGCLDDTGAIQGSAEWNVWYAAPGAGLETATSLVGAGTMPEVSADYEASGRCVGDWDTTDLEPGGRVFATLTSVATAPKVGLTITLRAKTESRVD